MLIELIPKIIISSRVTNVASLIFAYLKNFGTEIDVYLFSSRIGEYFPINLDSFKCLEENQIEHIDQFIYRFTKLQDSIGLRL